jgi:hypothetical protein
MGRLPKVLPTVRKKMPMLPLVLSSDSHVFEPPDLWQTRIDRRSGIGDFRLGELGVFGVSLCVEHGLGVLKGLFEISLVPGEL